MVNHKSKLAQELITKMEFVGKELDLSGSYLSQLVGGSTTLYKRLKTGQDISLRIYERSIHNINQLMKERGVMYEETR